MPMRSVLARGTFVASLSALLLGSASAAPVDVSFAPPPISTQCVIQPPVEAVAAKWEQWDRQSLPGTPDDVLAEIQRLRDFDAKRFLEPVTAALALMVASEDEAVRQKALVDRIRYFEAAGRAAQVLADGMIGQLETGFTALTSRSLFALAQAYLNGQGVAADQGKGEGYLLAAAADGNSDALLLAAQMRSEGELAQYGLDAKTAVTIALGGILGSVDPAICSRINRIARYYEAGEIVKQNYTLAEQWLRLAADLGDPSAAWKVARYHLSSEYIVKNNDVLIKYLTIAADAGIAAAKVELGEIYQAGSLVDQDLAKAETLYGEAADSGYQTGYLRLIALLEGRTAEPEVAQRLEQALRDLVAQPDAPAQAMVKLADLIIKKDGRWAAGPEVRSLLERAVEDDSPEAALLLADYVLSDPDGVDRAISLLNIAVSEGGKSEAMTRLAEIYMCHVPDAPKIELAASWTKRALAAGNSTALQAPAQDGEVDQLGLAQAQSMALRGASGRVAEYVEMLRTSDYGSDVLAFWEARLKRDPDAQNRLARLLVESDSSSQGVELSIRLLEDSVAAGSDAARVTLANLLLTEQASDPAARPRAIKLLQEAASHGLGSAIVRLEELHEEDTTIEFSADQYLTSVDTRGDLDAFLYAAANGPAKQRPAYLDRAASITSCSFSEVMKLARAYGAAEQKAETEHWLGIGAKITDGRGWQYASLAQEYAKLGADGQHLETVVALLEQAVSHGQISSLDRLIQIRSDPSSTAYDPDRVVALVQQAVAKADPAQLLNLARRVERANPALRKRITDAIDIRSIYQQSAEGGNATAMRELGKLLQQQATSPEQMQEAMDWIEQAATAKDPDAMLLLAKAYTVGIGREVSLDRAVSLLQDASALGNNDAGDMLESIEMLKAQQ